MGAGDPELEEMYGWDKNGPKINMRGPYGDSGGHFMSGPVYVCGAEPGDILQASTTVQWMSADKLYNPPF